MQASGQFFIFRTMLDPDGVEMDVFGKGAKQGKNIDDLGRVRRQFGLADGGRQFGRRRQIKRKRDVLGKVETAVGQGVVADVAAQCISTGTSSC